MKKSLLLLLIISQILIAKPRIALIVDDLGPDLGTYKKLLSIKYPITLAIMPGMNRTGYLIKKIPTTNFEIMIHFPWEAISRKVDKYDVKIDSRMSTQDIKKMINRAIEENPRAAGINNHMGSKISTNEYILRIFMADIKARGLYFVDSLTVKGSKAYQIAKKKKVPSVRNNIFLDSENRQEHFGKMFARAVNKAKKRGSLVAICHANRSSTIKTLPYLLDKYSSEVEYVFASELVK